LPSRQPIVDEIKLAYPELPKTIALISPGSNVSTYRLAAASDATIIYATKTGIELAARGIPVIVAGEAWIRGKGIGFDCDDAEAYERLLAVLPFGKRLEKERTARAQKYAYHFFFRRMIPMPGLRRTRMPGVPYEIAPLDIGLFAQGASAALDCVCNGLLKGAPFVFEVDAGASAP
jgi:hypothetical protein